MFPQTHIHTLNIHTYLHAVPALCATFSYVLHTPNSQTYIHACQVFQVSMLYIYIYMPVPHPRTQTSVPPPSTHTSDRRLISNFRGVSVSSRTFSSGEGCHSEIAGGGTGQGAAPPPRGERSEPLRTSTPVQRMSGDLLLPRAPASNDATTPTQSQPLAKRAPAHVDACATYVW